MSLVNSYQLDVDVIDHYGGVNSLESSFEWEGAKSVNIADKKMQMDLWMNQYSPSLKQRNYSSIEMFFDKYWIYYNTLVPESYSRWFKTDLSDLLWDSETQFNPQIELLKSASQATLLGRAKLGGADCYLLDIVPSREAMADWIISQQQPGGLNLQTASGTAAIVGKAGFVQFHVDGSCRLWVARDSHLIINSDIYALFQRNFDTGNGTSIVEFDGHLKYHDYNKLVSIEVPTEALNAQEGTGTSWIIPQN